MLAAKTIMATLPVRDLAAARSFYEDVLGLRPAGPDMDGVVTYTAGDAQAVVYETENAGSNAATAATFALGEEIDAIVAGLKARGVAFERYDMPDTRHDGDIHVSGDMRVAWFKDPSGNIICLVNG